MSGVILVALAEPGDMAKVDGFPASILDGLPVFCLADVTVREWIRPHVLAGVPVFIGGPGWVPDPDLAARTLCFPADDRDLAVIAHQRAVWEMTHSRTGDGEWHEIPRLVWEPQAPGWLAYGDRHGYLVSRGPDDRVRLTRWKVHSGAGPSEDLTVTFVRDVLDHAVVVTDPMQGQIFAQAFEDGRSIVGVPGWQVRGSTRPPFPRSPADLEQIIDWHPEGASRG